MVSEWPIGTLRDAIGEKGYIRGPFGSALRRPELRSSGVPVYEQQHAITGMREFRFYVDEEKYSTLKRFTVQPNDLIISCSGTLARVSMIRPEDPVGIISQALLILRPDTAVVWPKYLYYFMSSKMGFDSLAGVSTGSVQVNIAGRSIIERTELPLPPLSEQRAIAHILGTLDDKIELNRRMNGTLEAMARALYRSWFVDFNQSTQKNVAGRTSKRGTAEVLLSSASEAWISEGISSGWAFRPFSETVDILGGGTPKTDVGDYWNGRTPWFSVVDAPEESDVWVTDTQKHITEEGIANSSTQVLPVGTTILTARGTVGKVALVGTPMAMNQSCYGLRPRESQQGYFVYFQTRQIVNELKQAAHGSVFDTITRNTLASISVVFPADSLIRSFEDAVEPLMERIRHGLLESSTLASLRDTLLPTLISGELRIKDAGKIVGRAV